MFSVLISDTNAQKQDRKQGPSDLAIGFIKI